MIILDSVRSGPSPLLVRGLTQKKPVASISRDISAARLSLGDPEGFPPHPHEWFSIVVSLLVFCNYGVRLMCFLILLAVTTPRFS
jgi:hypothetical protein